MVFHACVVANFTVKHRKWVVYALWRVNSVEGGCRIVMALFQLWRQLDYACWQNGTRWNVVVFVPQLFKFLNEGTLTVAFLGGIRALFGWLGDLDLRDLLLEADLLCFELTLSGLKLLICRKCSFMRSLSSLTSWIRTFLNSFAS